MGLKQFRNMRMFSTSTGSDRSTLTADRAPTHNGDGLVTPEDLGPPPEIQSLPVKQFIWGAGMECSFIPHMKIDQFQWTQHDRFWKEDLRRARQEAGIANLR